MYLNSITLILGKKKRDTGYGFYGSEECGTIEDCFNLPCPKFGFAVRYSFQKNESNDLRIIKRQTGEGFRSAAPPDCRITDG